ncbi:uncharacterized protein LOC132928758 [Rhopalosiphum padi]|uniref:uncharacterized protein LOC132928758 n=1 Tax=Rhopalosiphum padi TaxID=40932 RepID=UPI00298E71BC|nr:uncharacterized protein LOC132928758 [Rhopalosiphum padi]
MGDSVDNYINATESDIMIKRQMIRAEFYNTYDVMTGIRIASTLGGFFLMMVLLVLYKSKCKTRSLSDQHLEAVIKAAVDQEEQLAALAKRSSSSSYCSGHGLCRCSPRYSMTENSVADCNNWNRKSKAYLSETQYHPYSTLSQTSNKFMKSSVLEYSFEEDEDDNMDNDDIEDVCSNNGYRVAKWLEVPCDQKWIPRGNSAITVSSNDTSYLEARGSSLIVGQPPSPLNHPPPAGYPPWEFYYPIDIQVIQPTPCMSPSGGSQESFSDVPRHTEQLLPAASERFRKPPQPPRKTVSSSSSMAAPIASIRTSCSSCSDDAASTATTVNSSVFVDECCCATASSPPPAHSSQTHDNDFDDGVSLASQLTTAEPAKASCARRYSPPPTTNRGNGTYRIDGDRDAAKTVGGAAVSAVRSYHDFNRRPQQPSTVGRNVIVVQADVNPVADSIVNANSLSGSLRALYDASKETLF